jgi:hypothetical protein
VTTPRSFAIAMSCAAALLASCGSAPTVRYHSLMPANATAPAASGVQWAIDAVTIPAQVDQPQWLVRMSDDSLRLLEQERWAGPLADELRGALSEALARRIGTPSVTKAASGKHWRVRVDVQRLELAPTRHAALVVDWSVGSGGAPELRCRDVQQRSVASGFDALAAAQREAVAALGERIAAAITALDRGGAACPG